MIAILSAALLLAAEPELTLEVNSRTIRQYDQVVVKAVVANYAEEPLSFTGELNSAANYIRFEMKKGPEWQAVREMGAGIHCGVPGIGPVLEKGATYAEYDSIHLKKHRISFVFDKPGKYVLRAVVSTSAGKLESKPVVVTVEPRKPDELRKIESSKQMLAWLTVLPLSQPLPQEVIALKHVGGNIGATVENLLFLETVRTGQQRLDGDDIVKTLRKKMTGIELEVGLHTLGTLYSQKLDWKHLQQVVDALPDATRSALSWEHNLDLHRPAEFVPSRTKKD